MPELPEVETTRRGIAPHIQGQTVVQVIIRQPQLRWPISPELTSELPGNTLLSVNRRGKYLIINTGKASFIVHLGMSGSLRIVDNGTAAGKHDHVDFVLGHGKILRYTDPRRFGSILWCVSEPAQHPLLKHLGPEPLTDDFNLKYLHGRAKGRKMPVKSFIMDSKVVVGVGNIYANEALFMAGIDPRRAAGRIAAERYTLLIENIKQILAGAITMGGTTLRDFVGGTGQPGYFKQSLQVYGRKGMPCLRCNKVLKEIRMGQRSTVYCAQCQS